MPANALGSYIQAELDRRGWTRQDLADRTEWSEPTIRRVINGRKPKWEMLHDISRVLEVSYPYLLELAGVQLSAVPTEEIAQHRRFAVLAKALPDLEEAAERFARLTPEQRRVVLGIMEVMEKGRQNGG
jgi:transcriptional regulator with XRE-family HTH domain